MAVTALSRLVNETFDGSAMAELDSTLDLFAKDPLTRILRQQKEYLNTY